MADTNSPGRTGSPAADARASAFVGARRAGASLPAYPGSLPSTMAEAYAVQTQAISLWPDRIAGWKVGRINAPWDAQYGTDRLAGPIFAGQLAKAGDAPSPIHLFAGGFGAVEGEIVIEVGQDAPASKLEWTLTEAAEIAGVFRLGMEIASSPFAGINDFGPLVTVSDFGNNNGLILGEEIREWRAASPTEWRLRTLIDGVEVGQADAASIPGGPLESFRAVLEICARIGHPLRRGMQITTGAVTGVHPLRPGQTASVEMAGLAPITCSAARAPSSQNQSNPA
ncbi:MAG: 2-keto-4-pentenoate hydratase [Acidobacteria bacterium]|nr:2-keto-4-pentenoate hydratase [Acidobacteriota bacterium]